ncbi:hypothetical protein ACWDYH_35780 [Nocardia goodfellowii]
MIEMGRLTPYSDFAGFSADMSGLVPRMYKASLAELNFGTVLGQVLTRSSKRGIAASPMVAVLAKSFANMEGTVRYLAPELSPMTGFQDGLVDIMIDLVRDMLSPAQAAATTLELMFGAAVGQQQTRRVVRDLSNRELAMQVASTDAPQSGRGSDLGKAKAAMALGSGALLGWLAADVRGPARDLFGRRGISPRRHSFRANSGTRAESIDG